MNDNDLNKLVLDIIAICRLDSNDESVKKLIKEEISKYQKSSVRSFRMPPPLLDH